MNDLSNRPVDTPIGLDETDHAIIALLREDGRLPIPLHSPRAGHHRGHGARPGPAPGGVQHHAVWWQ